MRIAAILNPGASTMGPDTAHLVVDALGVAGPVDVERTERAGHGLDLARRAIGRGCDVLVAVGGDGTANEVANAAAGTDTIVAVVAAGSTNVLARSIGLPGEPAAGARAVADALVAGRTRTIGLGQIALDGGRPRSFLFNAGLGFDAAVIRRVEARPGAKRRFGQLTYVAAVGRQLVGAAGPTSTVRSWGVDDRAVAAVGARATVVMNTSPYTYLGRRAIDLAPGTALDGFLSLVTADTPMRAVAVVGRAFGRRSLDGRRGVTVQRDIVTVEVSSLHPVPAQCDGEPLGSARSVSIRHRAGALRIAG